MPKVQSIFIHRSAVSWFLTINFNNEVRSLNKNLKFHDFVDVPRQENFTKAGQKILDYEFFVDREYYLRTSTPYC